MSKSRQIVLVNILKTEEDEDQSANTILNSVPLGSYDQVMDALKHFNTTPDGSDAPEGFGVLYGPGLIAQMPMVGRSDPVMQVAISMTEEEIAWPVIMRICRQLGWMMMDPSSGRTFSA